MTNKTIVKYSPWNSYIWWYMWKYWVAYDLETESWDKVTTLNRIKNFLSDYFSIQKPTKNLILWILWKTESWEFLWKGIDFHGNICHLFFIQVDKFKQSVIKLLDSWDLRKQPIET